MCSGVYKSGEEIIIYLIDNYLIFFQVLFFSEIYPKKMDRLFEDSLQNIFSKRNKRKLNSIFYAPR